MGVWSSIVGGKNAIAKKELTQKVKDLGKWYHRVDLGNGVVTPGDRNQSLVYSLYENALPDLDGLTVLDLGANACGLSVEFAKRGAHVTAIEIGATYVKQAEFVRDHFQLTDQIDIHRMDVYALAEWIGKTFDIVAYVGLSYHLRYPQLALDLLSHLCGRHLLVSTQTVEGTGLTMQNRARHVQNRELELLHGWEPSEPCFLSMIAHAGFQNARLVSTAPHPGEKKGSICGNRSYYFADAAARPVPLPFIDKGFVGKPEVVHARRKAR